MKKYGGHSGLSMAFLTELLLVILFFALSAAAAMSLFSKAAETADKAEKLSLAMFAAASAAEDLRTADNMESALLESYPGAEKRDGRYLLPLDDEMLPAENGGYRLAVTLSEEDFGAGVLQRAEIAVETALGEELYSLTAAGYIPGEARP